MTKPTGQTTGLMAVAVSIQLEWRELAQKSTAGRDTQHGKRFDYMTYPNRDHGLREGRGTEVHLRILMACYLIEHLPSGAR